MGGAVDRTHDLSVMDQVSHMPYQLSYTPETGCLQVLGLGLGLRPRTTDHGPSPTSNSPIKRLGPRTESDITDKFSVCDFYTRTESEAKRRTESVVIKLKIISLTVALDLIGSTETAKLCYHIELDSYTEWGVLAPSLTLSVHMNTIPRSNAKDALWHLSLTGWRG
ncbi:hypothetical protein LXL04_025638 [Taraxacum kok-saghyz]